MKIIRLICVAVLFMGSVQYATANPCPENNKYAQAPNGCSSWSNNGEQVRDTWGPVNFKPACDEHDKCYYTLGTTEESCNNDFNRRLLTACRDGLRKCGKTFFGKKWCSPPEPVSYATCAAIAEAMYAGVRVASRVVYREAQDKQRRHEQQCRRVAQQMSQCRNQTDIQIHVGNNSKSFDQNKSWKTCTGYLAVFQSDGNFVVYNPSGKAVWSSKTHNKGGNQLIMQSDGNLVIYASGSKPLWSSKTHGNPGAFLAIQNDGNVVIYSRDRKALWATGTNGK